jgi:hypothetical protein
MSMASRARAAAAKLALDEKNYGPFPDQPEFDPGLAMDLSRFYGHREEICEALDVREVIVTDDADDAEGILVVYKPQAANPALLAAAMTMALVAGDR